MSLKILVVTPTPTHPCDAGNRARIMNLVDALRDQGHELFLLHLEREKGHRKEMSHWLGDGHFRSLPYRGAQRIENLWQRFWRRGRQLFDIDARHSWGIDDWYDPALSNGVANWHAETDFDVVIVEYVFLSRLLEDLPERVLKILDTHDRFANRHSLYLAQGLPPQFFSTTPEEEKKALDRTDIVLAIQETERAAFAAQTRAEVLTLGHLVRIEPAQNDSSGSGRILIVGSENPFNLDGYRFFRDEVWPLIRSRLPKATLSVAGKLSHHVEAEDGIEPLGVIPDMIDAYRGIDVAVNPVLCGTGLNIKSIEALGFGVPLVATPSGARGLEQTEGQGLSIAESAQDFADAVISLVLDRGLRQQAGSRAIETAREWNGSALARLAQMLEKRPPSGSRP